eukprot:scaffold315452_cov27-Tisochrysis_lutea.AAC.1
MRCRAAHAHGNAYARCLGGQPDGASADRALEVRVEPSQLRVGCEPAAAGCQAGGHAQPSYQPGRRLGWAAASRNDRCERAALDRVAEWRTSAVRLDCVELRRSEAGDGERRPHELGLRLAIGRGEAGALPILLHRGACHAQRRQRRAWRGCGR